MDSDLRREILDAARRLLVTEGYNSLSMRKIARAIGYSATSIYLHFDSKEALFFTLIEEGMEMLYRGLVRAARGSTSPAERLERVCERYVRFGLENPEYYEIMFMVHSEKLGRFPPEKYRQARKGLELIAALLRDGSRRRQFEVEDPFMAAGVIWSSLHGAVALLLARRLDAGLDTNAFADMAVRVTLRGFLMPEPPAQQTESAYDARALSER